MSQDMVVLVCEGDVVEGHTTRGTRDRLHAFLLDDIRRLKKESARSALASERCMLVT